MQPLDIRKALLPPPKTYGAHVKRQERPLSVVGLPRRKQRPSRFVSPFRVFHKVSTLSNRGAMVCWAPKRQSARRFAYRRLATKAFSSSNSEIEALIF
jgi:hypothetical protein